jgi:3beta-hydroxy-Delta5-steroid dehydrogenase / steroid Delta-isomerase
MLQSFLRQLAKGAFVARFGPPEAVVDNTHVYNLVHAELLAAQRLAAGLPGGEAFFVTDDERINGLEWFRPLVEALGHPWPRVRLPGRLLWLVGWAGEVLHYAGGPEPTLTSGGVLKLIASTSFRVDKARRELGWAPIRKRDDGLAEAMDDLRALYARLREAR